MTVLSARPHILILCNLLHQYLETILETILGTSLVWHTFVLPIDHALVGQTTSFLHADVRCNIS